MLFSAVLVDSPLDLPELESAESSDSMPELRSDDDVPVPVYGPEELPVYGPAELGPVPELVASSESDTSSSGLSEGDVSASDSDVMPELVSSESDSD